METIFDSAELARADRFDAWRDLTADSLMPTVLSSARTSDFRASMRVIDLGTVQVSALTYSPLRSQRTPKLIRRSDPDLYSVGLILRGQQTIDQAGRETTPGVRDLVVYSSFRPYDAWVSTGAADTAESIVVQVPRAVLALPSGKEKLLLAARLPGREGIGGLFAHFLTHMAAADAPPSGTAADVADAADCAGAARSANPGGAAGHCAAGGADAGQGRYPYRPTDRLRLGAVLTDLLTALLAHHLEDDACLPPESRQGALFLQFQAFIRQELGNLELSPETVAAAHHISLRYLHRIFRNHGHTVAAWIRRERLEHCRRALADPALRPTPIHRVAAHYGFAHPSVFSRAFAAAYGCSPRDYRDHALHAGRPPAGRPAASTDPTGAPETPARSRPGSPRSADSR
jgi:AraC-like DNA-binding protein